MNRTISLKSLLPLSFWTFSEVSMPFSFPWGWNTLAPPPIFLLLKVIVIREGAIGQGLWHGWRKELHANKEKLHLYFLLQVPLWCLMTLPNELLIISGPITSLQINGETVETVADFIFLGSKITADSDCSHEIKRRLLLGREVMTNLDSILKSRDITLPTKVCLVKAMVFPVVMYECESLTIKKVEHQCIDAFELWCWRRLLRVPWMQGDPTSPSWRRSVLGVHWKDCCWSWNSSTLATWCEELTLWKRPWCWERVRAGGEGDDRRWDGWMASLTRWTWVWVGSGSWWWTGRSGMLWFMGLQRVGHDWATVLNWTEYFQPVWYSISSLMSPFISALGSAAFVALFSGWSYGLWALCLSQADLYSRKMLWTLHFNLGAFAAFWPGLL